MAERKRITQAESDALRELIRGMTRDSLIYKLLKDELSVLGHWKNKPRGKPAFQ